MYTDYTTYSLIDYHGINRDFPSWYDMDFYKVPRIVFVYGRKKLAYFIFFLWLIKKYGRKDISFHCFGLQACIFPLVFGFNFVYHGYGDILSTPFVSEARIKVLVRVFLARLSLKFSKAIVLSQSTDVPYLMRLKVDMNKVKFIPLLNNVHEISMENKTSLESFYFLENRVIFVPTRHSEIKQLGMFIDALKIVFRNNRDLFDKNKIRVVFIKWGELWQENLEKLRNEDIGDYLLWIELQSHTSLSNLISKSYLVINEFTDPVHYPGFIGGITRDAMSLGKAVITHYSFDYDHFFHKSPPPLFKFENNVNSLKNVLERTLKLSEDEVRSYGVGLQKWYNIEYNIIELINRTISLHNV